MAKNEYYRHHKIISCGFFALIVILNGIFRFGIISTSQFDVKVPPMITNIPVAKENDFVARFLNNNIRDVINATLPTYIPHLNNECFWEQTRYGNQLRCLPGAYLIGFSKSGTSELHLILTLHQHVIRSDFKEPHFWNRPTSKMTIRDYVNEYALASSIITGCCLSEVEESYSQCGVSNVHNASDMPRLQNLAGKHRLKWAKNRQVARTMAYDDFKNGDYRNMNQTHCPVLGIDATPSYIYNEKNLEIDPANRHHTEPTILAAEKIHYVQPNAKSIVIMRNPEDRLWSDYNFYPRHPKHRRSPDDFHAKVKQGIKWWIKCIQQYSHEKCAYGNIFENIENPGTRKLAWTSTGATRVRIGLYHIFVKRWLSVFPRKNMLFLRFEDFIQEPVAYVNKTVVPFLGLEPFSNYSISKINEQLDKKMKSRVKPKRLQMRNETRQLLASFYKRYNQKIANLLEDDKFLWQDKNDKM